MNSSLTKQLFLKSMEDSNALSKALANYLFREIIEDAHAKYNISEEDMKMMCENAVNRAEALIRTMDSVDSIQPLAVYSYSTKEWNSPDEEQVNFYYEFFSYADEEIKEVKKSLMKL